MHDDEYNVRLFNKMIEAISEYRNGHIELALLISRLEGLNLLLNNYCETWSEKFYRAWVPLEEIYSVALDRNCGIIDESGKLVIKQSIKELEELVEKKLQ